MYPSGCGDSTISHGATLHGAYFLRRFLMTFLWFVLILLLLIIWLIREVSSPKEKKRRLRKQISENTVKIAMLIDDLESRER